MLRLSRLSRARAINVRLTSPGHTNQHYINPARCIDPDHPAASHPIRDFPAFVCPQFIVRAFPRAVLHEPADFVPVNPLLATGLVRARKHTHQQRKWWSNLTEPPPREIHNTLRRFDAIKRAKLADTRHLADARVSALAAHGRHSISLLYHTSKKTSQSCVIRRRLRSKMTTAINLVVSRNADAVDAPSSDQPRKETPYPPLHLVSRPTRRNEHFVLQGWTYLVIPYRVMYKMPLPNIVQIIRKALPRLNQQAKHLETLWSVPPERTPCPPVDRRPSSTLRLKSVDRSQPAIGTPTHDPRPLHPAPERTQELEPVKRQSRPLPLYSHQPVFLPRATKG